MIEIVMVMMIVILIKLSDTTQPNKWLTIVIPGMCDSDPGPPEQGAYHYWTGEESRAPWDKLPDDGYPRCLKDEVFLDIKSWEWYVKKITVTCPSVESLRQ